MSWRIQILARAAAILVVLFAGACTRRGPQFDEWQVDHHGLKVRIREFDDGSPILLPKGYYTFEAKAPGSNHWRELLFWDTKSERFPIDRKRIQFVDDRTVFAYSKTEYVVTTDLGRTWSMGRIPRASWLEPMYIWRIDLQAVGTGRMLAKY